MKPANLEILAYEQTPLGPLCLRRREILAMPGTVVTEVTLNHEFLMSSYNTDSERALANRSVALHGGRDLKVLVGGLGLGYTAHELLKNSRVATVEVIELLPQVIDWLRRGLMPLSTELAAREELKLTPADVYQRLARDAVETYDVIVIDVDHSPDDPLGEEENAFYTPAGLAQAATHLRKGGVLAVWSYAESSPFSQALRSTFARVVVEPVRTMNALVGHEQTDWLFFGLSELPAG